MAKFLCLRFFPGWWAPAPLRPVGRPGRPEDRREHPGCRVTLRPPRGVSQHPPSSKPRPGAPGGTAFSPPFTPQLLVFWVCPPCFFLCERSGSKQLVSRGHIPFTPRGEEGRLLLQHREQRGGLHSKPPGAFVLCFVVCWDRRGQKSSPNLPRGHDPKLSSQTGRAQGWGGAGTPPLVAQAGPSSPGSQGRRQGTARNGRGRVLVVGSGAPAYRADLGLKITILSVLRELPFSPHRRRNIRAQIQQVK